MPVLYYEAGDGAGRKVEFNDSVVLGRLRTAQVPIPDAEASREHTRVVREADGSWFAVDCGSRNGTEVNGSKVARHALKSGDRIRIAKTVLRFEDSAAPTGAPEQALAGVAGPPGVARPGDAAFHAAPGPAHPPVIPAAALPPPVPAAPAAAPRPSGRIAAPAAPPGVRPSGSHRPPEAGASPPGPPRPHGPTGPSAGAQMAAYALLVALFVGLLFLSKWIAGIAIDRMVQNQRQQQPK